MPDRPSSDAKMSPLLRLPGEVRNMIYEYVFTVDKISIQYDYHAGYQKRPYLLLCKTDGDLCGPHPAIRTWMDLVSPSFVCHQIYDETRCHPYRLNTFVFTDWIFLFNGWVQGLGNDQRGSIHALHIEVYELPLGKDSSGLRRDIQALKEYTGLQRISVSSRIDQFVQVGIKKWASRKGSGVKYTEEIRSTCDELY